MKKLHVALALAGALAGTVHAQSAVEIYGVVDMGYVRESGEVTGLRTSGTATPPNTQIQPGGNKLSSGAQSGSRLGFKGTEDLGDGMKGLFVLETGIAVDRGGFNQNNTAFARQAFVGLQSNVGTFTLGRQYTSYFLALNQVADPFASGLAGNAQNLMLPSTAIDGDRLIRMSDAIKYATPIFNNFRGELAYGFAEKAPTAGGTTATTRTLTGSVTYSMAPLNVTLAHFRKNSPTVADHISSTMLAANYDLGVAKAFVAYANNDWLGTVGKSRDFLIGATVPFGPHTFIASYIRKDGRGAQAANDADQWGLGYTYALSKRTNLYAAYGHISNDGAAIYTVGNNSENGTGNKAFNLGVRHLF